MASQKNKRVSLVLGSGGAKGLAHIGIIYALKAKGYEISSIAGSSIGAMVGGVYAAGKLEEFEQWVRAFTPSGVVSLMDLAWGRGGLVKGDRAIDTLKEIIGDRAIESLPIRFTAVASNISQAREVWLNKGSLFDAIRASVSLPLFLTPVQKGEDYLIDGGVLNPVPIAPVFSDDSDLIVAVNLNGDADEALKQQVDAETEALERERQTDSSFNAAVDKFIKKLRNSDDAEEDKSLGAYDIASQAFDAMQGTIARQKLAAYPPDVLIELPRNVCGTMDFDRASPLIDLGYQKAMRALP